jgi:serine/threonine protein kinase
MSIDYIEGTTLSKLLEKSGFLSITEALEITLSILSAVQHAHEQGVVHRDLKPSNIMLRETDGGKYAVMVLDFGIAKVHKSENDETTHELTRTGAIFGSPLCMSPEQAKGQKADHRSDIYSIGCILYEALTGTPPLRGATSLETMVKQITDIPVSLHEASFGRNFPPLLEETVFKALAKNPNERFSSASEFAKQLEDCLGGALSRSAGEQNGPLSNNSMESLATRFFVAFFLLTSLGAIVYGAWSYFKEPSRLSNDRGNQVNDDISRLRTQIADQERNAPEKLPGQVQSEKSIFTKAANSDVIVNSLINYSNNRDGNLELSHTPLKESNLAYLASKKNLRTLTLKNCDTDNKLFDYIADLPLQKLTLDFMKLNDQGFAQLHGLSTLSELQMWHANGQMGRDRILSGDGLKNLAKLRHLRKLNLWASAFSNWDLRILPSLKMLESLDLSNKKFDDQAIDWLEQMPNLSELTLSHNNVSVSRIGNMKNLAQLHSLAIVGNYRFDKFAFRSLAENAKSLQSLDLSYTNVTLDEIEPLFSMKGLRDLNLTNCKNLSERDVRKVVAQLPNCDTTSDFDQKLQQR